MKDRNFRDTRRRSPPPRNRSFRNETRLPGSHRFEPERSRGIGPVQRTERDDDQPSRYYEKDRSSNITAQYSKSMAATRGGESESASFKFRWNNLLDAKQQLENAPSSTTKNPVSGFGFGYGIGTRHEKRGFSHGDGFPDSGVVPIGAPRNYRHTDGGFVSPLGKNEVGLHNKSEFQMPKHWEHQQQQQQHHQHQYQQHHQEHHQHQQHHMGYGVSVSQSQPNASSSFGGYFAEDVHVHVQMPKSNSIAEIPNAYGRVQQCSVPVMNRDFNYSEMQRSENSDAGIMPDDDDIRYVNITLRGEFRHQEFRRPSIVDSIVDRIDGVPCSHGHPLRKGVTWEESLSSEQHLTPKYQDLTQSQPSKHCVEQLLGSRNMHPQYGTEGYDTKVYEKDAHTSNYQDSWKGLPVLDCDQYFYKQEGIMSKTEELVMHDLDDVEMFELKCSGITNENQVWTDFNAGLPHRQCASDTFDDEETSFDEDIIQFDKRSTSPYSPVPAKTNSRTQQMIIGKSMKKKSRPARIIPLPNSLVSSSRNVHARLGPRVVPPTENPYAGKYIKSKNIKRNLHDFSKTATCSDLSDVKVKVKHTKRSKTEPPEDSKEFKQLVQNAFFKFVKLLNENPAQRRKYTDQGGIDTLRCTLCGSKSKEFANTHSLAMHAFNSTKAQCRAEHLGFHKALCVLLGWSDAAASDGLWVQQMLPAAEASNLKSDLIIWPPIILVHNSSIAHYDPDKRMIVSIEGLEAILRGMGFGGGKTKVCRGKPANYSILVVTFNATFSGLQEAERLHKFYADNKRGRAEFQQIDGSSLKNSNEETQFIPGNEESALYGYLGNAEDLDKLDFESKKHSVVKSKKEIQAIADATLGAD